MSLSLPRGRAPRREKAAQPQGTQPQGAAPPTRAELERARSAVLAVWRARALRYTLIYLALVCALVTLRYQTREVGPVMRELSGSRTQLQNERDALSLELQTLRGEQRVREWALANGMQTYAQAPKTSAEFTPMPAPPAVPAPHFEVRTLWK